MRVVVSNCVSLNGGDAAILRSLMRTLRLAFGSSLRQVDVFDKQPDVARRYYGDVSFHQSMWGALGGRFGRWRRWRATALLTVNRKIPALRPALQLYENADAVISTGGTYLVEHYDLAGRLFDFEATLSRGVPLVLFTQSMGPFSDPENQRRLRRIVDEAALVLLRDERSRGHVLQLGVADERLHVVADSVFVLVEPHVLEAAKARRLGATPRAAVSVRNWAHFRTRDASEGMEAYRRSVAACVDTLVESGFEVTFLSTCQGIPEYWIDDSHEAREVSRYVSVEARGRVEIDSRFHDPLELRRVLGEYDLVVATRMHAAVLALSAGTPVFPIAYEFKTTELFTRLGCADFVQDIETIEPSSVIKGLAGFLDGLDATRPALMDGVLREHASAVAVADLLRKAVHH